jgi:hypothetical protein
MIYIIDGCDPNNSNWMRYVSESTESIIGIRCFFVDLD